MSVLRWGIIGCGAVTEKKSGPAYRSTPGFELAAERKLAAERSDVARNTPARPARPHAPSDAEGLAHDAFLEKITDPIWRD